jgi:Na+-driven multidrug efflux pump
MSGSYFWRGFFPLLATVALGQAILQIDIITAARTGAGALAAYALLLRVAVLDMVATTALATVASIFVARAGKCGRTAEILGPVTALALVSGVIFGLAGFFLYPVVVAWISPDRGTADLVDDVVIWFAFAAPFRAFSGVAGLALFGLGSGTLVTCCRLAELAAKAAGNLLLVDLLETGFSGLYISGFVVSVGSSLWLWRALARHGLSWPQLPDSALAGGLLRAAVSEAYRLLSPQVAVAISFGLFSVASWGGFDPSRLDSYAAGQTLVLLVVTPLAALTRYTALRSAALPKAERHDLILQVSRTGLPIVIVAAVTLFFGAEKIGSLIYGQQGPWWIVLVQALALSLPLRFAGCMIRAIMQAANSFTLVAAADSATVWLVAVPLVALGLWIDSPRTCYASLVLPEALCVAWLWHRSSVRRFS